MRFKANGPAIPDVLLDERDAGHVVFLCGAGVSIEAGMPSFRELAEHVTNELHAPSASEVRRALRTYDAEGPPVAGWRRPSLDEVFQMLYREYGPERVLKVVWRKLRQSQEAQRHHTIVRLSANTEGHPQLVTTNFDHLFETAVGKEVPRYEAPIFPDLRRSPTGITYLHGRRADSKSDPHNYILSSADLGRAYLAEGWATSFVQELLQRFTVVLLGYQEDDPPVRYLLQGLGSASRRPRDRLFAFDKGTDQEVRAKWSDRDVRAIPYIGNDHDALWETLEAWAERAKNVEEYRRAVECEWPSKTGASRARNGRPLGQERNWRQAVRRSGSGAGGGVVVCIRCVVQICDAKERHRQLLAAVGSSSAAVRSSGDVWSR